MIGASSARISAARPCAKRHMQEAEQQHDPHRRQFDAAEQRKPDAEQQADFEGAEAAEIRRPPFHDQRQRGAERRGSFATPAARSSHRACSSSPASAATPKRNQRSSSFFCAAASAPRSHRARSARSAPGRRRNRHADWPTAPSAAAARTTARAAIGGAINPPTQATITGSASTCGRANRCGTVSASAAATNTSVVLSRRCRLTRFGQQRKCRGDRACRQHHRPAPARERIRFCVHHLRQPLRGDPGLAAHGEGIDVGGRHRAVVDDPLPDRDLPHRIGIDQQAVAGQQKQRIDGNADP